MYAFRCMFEDVHVVFSDALRNSKMFVMSFGVLSSSSDVSLSVIYKPTCHMNCRVEVQVRTPRGQGPDRRRELQTQRYLETQRYVELQVYII